MYQGAASFNRDISKWQVASVNNMNYMFRNAASFKQNLCGARWVRNPKPLVLTLVPTLNPNPHPSSNPNPNPHPSANPNP